MWNVRVLNQSSSASFLSSLSSQRNELISHTIKNYKDEVNTKWIDQSPWRFHTRALESYGKLLNTSSCWVSKTGFIKSRSVTTNEDARIFSGFHNLWTWRSLKGPSVLHASHNSCSLWRDVTLKLLCYFPLSSEGSEVSSNIYEADEPPKWAMKFVKGWKDSHSTFTFSLSLVLKSV